MLRQLAGTTFAIVLCVVGISLLFASEDRPQPKTVELTEILAGRVQILGLLGQPIGELVELRGVWTEPSTLASTKEPRRFEVTHVNGSQLQKPIAYLPPLVHQWNRNPVVASTGDVWAMVAYEAIEVRQHSRLRERLKQSSAADYSGNFGTILGEVVKVANKP